ncbi:MAG: hypothetical protein ACYTF1_09685 [Planctomycetota bacterium]|jgi:hypothetical protein
MRKVILVLILIPVFFTIPAVSGAAEPPSRPLALTTSQFDYVCQLETHPDHLAVLDIHAAYQSDRQKRMETNLLVNDILTAAYYFGFPGTMLLLLF